MTSPTPPIPTQTTLLPHYYFITYPMEQNPIQEDLENQQEALLGNHHTVCILCREEKTERIFRHNYCTSHYHLTCLNQHTLQTKAISCVHCNQEIVVPYRHYISQWMLFVFITTISQECLGALSISKTEKDPNLALFLFGISLGLALKNNYDLIKIHGPLQHGVLVSSSLLASLIVSGAITSPEVSFNSPLDLYAGMITSIPILVALSNNTPLSHVKFSAASMALSIPFLLVVMEGHKSPATLQSTIGFFEFTISSMIILLYCKPCHREGDGEL